MDLFSGQKTRIGIGDLTYADGSVTNIGDPKATIYQ
jgi:hypothetical protein